MEEILRRSAEYSKWQKEVLLHSFDLPGKERWYFLKAALEIPDYDPTDVD